MKKRKDTTISITVNKLGKNEHTGKKTLSCNNKYTHKVSIDIPAKKRRADIFKFICWIIIPIIVLVLVLLDALSVYNFNKDRLCVLGISLLIILLPFINEIKLKNFSFKRQDKDKDKDED